MKVVVGTRTYLGPDFHHVDVDPTPLVDKDGGRHPVDTVADARKIPLPDGCAELVYSQECLEHFYWKEYPKALREWARLVAPGGRLRIEVPDFLAAIRQVLVPSEAADGKPKDSEEYAAALDIERRIQQIVFGGQVGVWDVHFVGLTPRMLTEDMEKLGLTVVDVKRGWEHGYLLVEGERPI